MRVLNTNNHPSDSQQTILLLFLKNISSFGEGLIRKFKFKISVDVKPCYKVEGFSCNYYSYCRK